MNVYQLRKRGQELTQTDGSRHYKTAGEVEPLDLTIAYGHGAGFCIGNIIKYACRYTETNNFEDVIKCADYVHILAGIAEQEQQEKQQDSLEKEKIIKMIDEYEKNGDLNTLNNILPVVRSYLHFA